MIKRLLDRDIRIEHVLISHARLTDYAFGLLKNFVYANYNQLIKILTSRMVVTENSR